MLKHNLESDPAEDYELVQVISEDKGRQAWKVLLDFEGKSKMGSNIRNAMDTSQLPVRLTPLHHWCAGMIYHGLSAHRFTQAEFTRGLPGTPSYVHCDCRAIDRRAAALSPWAQSATGAGQGTTSPWIQAGLDATAVTGLCTQSFRHSLLWERLPGPLPGWTWSGFGLHLLSSATLLPVSWDSCCGHHPKQLWLKRHSGTRKGAQRCPAAFVQSVHPVPLLSWLSFCYVRYCQLMLALVPLLQSWWSQVTPTCSTPWTAMWTSISSCGKKLRSMRRWKWGAGAVWHSLELPNGGAGATGPAKLQCEGDNRSGATGLELYLCYHPVLQNASRWMFQYSTWKRFEAEMQSEHLIDLQPAMFLLALAPVYGQTDTDLRDSTDWNFFLFCTLA